MNMNKVYELNRLLLTDATAVRTNIKERGRERTVVKCDRTEWNDFINLYVIPNDMLYNVGDRVYVHDDLQSLYAVYYPGIRCIWLYGDYHVIVREYGAFYQYPKFTVNGGPLFLIDHPVCGDITMVIMRLARIRCQTPCNNGLVKRQPGCDNWSDGCYGCVYRQVSEMFTDMANYECDQVIKAICQEVK